ncbi:zinc finger protein 862 [Lingula anatina]|uniref:Zinc finger protein 862 n=1 Tax=Lingula anatina TaxID=7574 RepID=A0A1S3IXF6_LINAN|nr:zinc finger protein 862 [Lingula anatina]|eukprot:XP_013402713.1 zinc finger protein 862 [Lingula anatina]
MTPPERKPLQKSFMKIEESETELMHAKFITAFKVAICNQPYTSFSGELELLERVGASKNLTTRFSSDKSCAEFIKYIAKDIRDNLATNIRKGFFFSILCDGCTDSASLEEEIVYVRYLTDENQPRTVFLCISSVEKPDAEHIFDHLCDSIKNYVGVDDLKGLIAFVADGASVNFGVRNGVYRRFCELMPETVGIHCLAHRFELAIRDGGKKSSVVQEFSDLCQLIYKLYKSSSVQKEALKTTCSTHNIAFNSPENVMGTRWISHRSRAVTVLKKLWKPLVVHTTQIVEGIGSKRAEILGKAKKINNTLTNLKIVIALPVVQEILEILQSISLALQESSYIMSCAQSRIKATLRLLKRFNIEEKVEESAKTIDLEEFEFKGETVRLGRGENIEKCKGAIVNDLTQFLKDSISTIEERFGDVLRDQDSVCENVQVFNVSKWPSKNSVKFEEYGDEKIEKLSEHFRRTLDNAGFKTSMCQVEWPQFKKSVLELHEKGQDTVSFLTRMLTVHKDIYPNICALLAIVMVLPVSTADAERGFSLMKRIKTDWRASLTPSSLSNLMTVKLSKVKLDKFVPDSAYGKWLADGRRVLDPKKYARKIVQVPQKALISSDISDSETDQDTESDGDDDD